MKRKKMKILLIFALLTCNISFAGTIRPIADERIPSIDGKVLNDIVNNTKYNAENFSILFLDEENKIKKSYVLDDLIRNINRDNKDDIFIAKDKNFTIFLTKEEFYMLDGIKDIDVFVDTLNDISNANFETETMFVAGKRIVTVGNFPKSALETGKTVKYVLLIPKKHEEQTELNRAFLHFSSYELRPNKSKTFNLSALEVLELYSRLIKWQIDIAPMNSIILSMFKAKAHHLDNFLYTNAYNDLKEKLSLAVVEDIKESILYVKTTPKYSEFNDEVVDFQFATARFSEFLKHFQNEKLSLHNSSDNPIVTIKKDKLCKPIVVADLINCVITGQDKGVFYKAEVITNRYVRSGKKEVVLSQVMTRRLQVEYLLSKAISVANKLKIVNSTFSSEALKSELIRLKKDFKWLKGV